MSDTRKGELLLASFWLCECEAISVLAYDVIDPLQLASATALFAWVTFLLFGRVVLRRIS